MRKPIQGIDYFVYFQPMHGSIGGYISVNPDGTFTIVLNERLARERNMKTMEHEINHIMSDDFYNGKDVVEIEHL